MPLNLQVFKTRALTAIVFVVIMLAGLLCNQWSFLILFTIVHFGCLIEYQQLVGKIDKSYLDIPVLHKYGIMLAGWGIMLWLTDESYHIGNIRLHEFGWSLLLGCIIALPLIEVLFSKKFGMRHLTYSFAGFLYISLSWALLLDLRGAVTGHYFNGIEQALPIVIIASVWITDTMAYIVGSFIGKTPLSSISPKKTWEGTIGGALLAVTVVTLGGYYIFGFEVRALLLISATTAIAGTFGDLWESKLKRMAGVKDSGQIMPGHGGFLDRFDSLLFATPFVWLIVNLVL